MPSGFIEILIRPPQQTGRRRRKRLLITTRAGVRCEFTAGIPADLAAQVLAVALRWRRRGARC